jgi:hypothetical protein
LGPVEEYELVTKLHRDFEGLKLLGLAYPSGSKLVLRPRALAYLKQLLSYVRENAQQHKDSIDRTELEEVVKELEATLAGLKKVLGYENRAAPSTSNSSSTSGNAPPAKSSSEKRYVVEMDRATAFWVENYASTLGMSVAEAIEDMLKKIFGLVFLRDLDFRVREL